MLEDKEEAIVPAVVKAYDAGFLEKVALKASNQIKADGELILIWPDILDGAKNWREYHTEHLLQPLERVASSPALKLKDAAIAAGVCLAVAVIATLAVTLLAHSSLAYLSLTSNVFLKVSMVASVYLISQAIVIGIIPVLLKVNSVNSTGAEFVCIDCKQPILHPELKQAIQHLHFVLKVLIRLVILPFISVHEAIHVAGLNNEILTYTLQALSTAGVYLALGLSRPVVFCLYYDVILLSSENIYVSDRERIFCPYCGIDTALQIPRGIRLLRPYT